MKIALTIAGSDPSGGAGFQVDLRTFKAMGVYGLSVPSVLTAQNTRGVNSVHELPEDFFTAQLDTLLDDVRPDALKTGMVYTAQNMKIIAEKIKEHSLDNLVVDPIIISSTGVPLIKEEALKAMKDYLLPAAKVITPNINEASALTGMDIQDKSDMKDAAMRLKDYGVQSVIITGGHMKGKAMDLLFDGAEFMSLENKKLEGKYHGTGCVFSAAIAACLALDYGIIEAFIKAKEFTFDAIKSAGSVGSGMKILNI
ncbi:MAG: bifunctional hydroxymethylpyrimidine kinase/phosphomethylpyrimidine kinase [Nitrospirae bacterium]|nr:bifunctional hydroxymethylpyrimidine kinase/phosphomethylpyrimidine kinase [Nitrospirota bacterium]